MRISSRPWPSIPRLAAIVAIVVALALALNFGRQATLISQLHREQGRLEQAVAEEEAKLAALEARKTYVQTDEFVEEWARTVAKLVQAGETRVVLIPQGERPVEPVRVVSQPLSAEGGNAPSHWQQWWELFFGSVAEYGLD